MRTTDSEPFAINNSEEPQNQVEEGKPFHSSKVLRKDRLGNAYQ